MLEEKKEEKRAAIKKNKGVERRVMAESQLRQQQHLQQLQVNEGNWASYSRLHLGALISLMANSL